MISSQSLIDTFQLLPHPEGGWYKENYRSEATIPKDALPEQFEGDRQISTAIYFLLEEGNFSAFHRIRSDECWHFYAGQTLEIFELSPNGTLKIISLGNSLSEGTCFQYVVPAGYWFASRPAEKSSFCFVGCTVAPGFDFNDFELAKASDLIKAFPQHEMLIRSLCRQ